MVGHELRNLDVPMIPLRNEELLQLSPPQKDTLVANTERKHLMRRALGGESAILHPLDSPALGAHNMAIRHQL
ncbi:hypothetical protein VNO78_02031 [Psophocarpus tetragonolobus]|uniref:Uncharacterized protein n=1 Tax=Psophocarpus tetragonolobus TaxID=3891 RepID=A0AAN9TA41_PSOTE